MGHGFRVAGARSRNPGHPKRSVIEGIFQSRKSPGHDLCQYLGDLPRSGCGIRQPALRNVGPKDRRPKLEGSEHLARVSHQLKRPNRGRSNEPVSFQ